jgi:hypothetical protein
MWFKNQKRTHMSSRRFLGLKGNSLCGGLVEFTPDLSKVIHENKAFAQSEQCVHQSDNF